MGFLFACLLSFVCLFLFVVFFCLFDCLQFFDCLLVCLWIFCLIVCEVLFSCLWGFVLPGLFITLEPMKSSINFDVSFNSINTICTHQ